MRIPVIQHNVDPMRFPKVQGGYEGKAKKSFNSIKLFGDLVKTMVDIQKDKK